MQTLRQSRLSVSKLSKKEWEFILCLVEPDDESEPATTRAATDANKLDTDVTAPTNGDAEEQDATADTGAGANVDISDNDVPAQTNGNSKQQDDVINTADIGSKDRTIHLSDLSVPTQTPSQPGLAPSASE